MSVEVVSLYFLGDIQFNILGLTQLTPSLVNIIFQTCDRVYLIPDEILPHFVFKQKSALECDIVYSAS